MVMTAMPYEPAPDDATRQSSDLVASPVTRGNMTTAVRPDLASAGHTVAVQSLVAGLVDGELESIHAFGREICVHASAHADEILAQVKGRDLELIGGKLGEIVTTARSLNLNALSARRSNIPLVGALLDRLRLKAGEVSQRFDDVRAQVDALIVEVQQMQHGLIERNRLLEESFASVREEHDLLGLHIDAGEGALKILRDRLQHWPGRHPEADAMAHQKRHDLQSAIDSLDKRIADMRALQHASLQQLPMIRMVQANNRMLAEKFHTIRELTVPAWKRQFMLALSLNEQQSAVKLANSIDDATNAFLLENSRLLKDNTISTARANQRLVIDIQTLQAVHDGLLETMDEVIRINEEGTRQRAAISHDLRAMREKMTVADVRDHDRRIQVTR